MSESLTSTSAGMRRHPMLPALVLSLAVCLTQFDVTAAAVALPSIRADLGFGIAGTAWVMDAYSLAFAGTLFFAGALGDRFGRRRILIFGNIAFALASLLCGLAWDGPTLWAARAMQGAASAFTITGGLATISLAYPVSDATSRARAFGIIGVTGGAAMALGPTLGGFITSAFDWRWVFLINLPICAASDYALRRMAQESKDAEGRPLDMLGVLLLTLAIALPVQALLHDGAALLRWAGLGGGLLFMVALVRQQRRQPRPMLDPTLFMKAQPIGIGSILLSLSVGYWAVLVYLPMYLKSAFALSMDQVGIAMLAATLPMLVLPPVGVWLTQTAGWRVNFTGGMALLSIGMVLLAICVMRDAPLWQVLAAMLVGSSGAGLSNSQVSGALVATAPPDRAGMASAMATTLRQAGFAIGIALLGAVSSSGTAFAPAFIVAAAGAALGALAALLTLKKTLV